MNYESEYAAAMREMFNKALGAVDARAAVRQAVDLEGSRLKICDRVFDVATRKVYGIAVGKAAAAMAVGLDEVIGERIVQGVISAPLKRESPIPTKEDSALSHWKCFASGHPLPDQNSLEAAQAAFNLLQRADEERALVIFLISGGGSANIEWPRDEGITLEDLREANRQLVLCGASINEVNTVRRAFSAVKGGKLAARAARADQITLIVSDTNPGDEASVASGPTMLPQTDGPTATAVVKHYGVDSSLPSSIRRALSQPENTGLGAGREGHASYHVLLNNHNALEAAAQSARQFCSVVAIAADICEQPIAHGCDLLITRLIELFAQSNQQRCACLISGGEFACPVKGPGIGGRNLETVLRCAIELDTRSLPWGHAVILSAGTDGIDGNSPAAGAIADHTTISRGNCLHLNASSFLERSDAFTFFKQINDLITTGPTGTNVRDIRILLAQGVPKN